MGVKSNGSAGRVLDVLEAVARLQPIGVSALARALRIDKSAAQRALVTLAEKGWIATAQRSPTRWELTLRIFTVAHIGGDKRNWIRNAREPLEQLRDATGECALLTIPQAHHFVVVEVAESRQLVRSPVPVGSIAPSHISASGRAVLPYLPPERQCEMLGAPPDETLSRAFAATRADGYAVSAGLYYAGLTSIGAPVFESDGQPVGAVVVTGPRERITEADYPRIGAQVAATANGLSLSAPARQG